MLRKTGLLIAALALIGCSSGGDSKPQGVEQRLSTVETVTPVRTHLPIKVELTGTVEAMMKADIYSRVTGIVEDLPEDIDIGRHVVAGEKLMQLAVPDLRAKKKEKEAQAKLAQNQKELVAQTRLVLAKEVTEAEKQVKRFEAEVTYQEDQLKRISDLVARQALQPERKQEAEKLLKTAQAAWEAALAGVDTKKAKLRAADSEYAVADARISVADAEVHSLAVMIDEATIRAPFDGVITRRLVDRGATIKDTITPLLTIANVDKVRVLLDVPERDVALVNAVLARGPNREAEEPAIFRVWALREQVEDGEFTGSLTRSSTALDPVTRTMRTEMHIDNPDGHLRPGMYGSARITLAERYDAMTIPSSALIRRPNGRIEVYVLTNLTGNPLRGVIRRKEVVVGLDDGRRAEIRKGLNGDERIIAKGNGAFQEGDTVISVNLQ